MDTVFTIFIWVVIIILVVLSFHFFYQLKKKRAIKQVEQAKAEGREEQTASPATKNLFIKLYKNAMEYTWWEIVIFIIGAVSFFSILFLLFYPVKSGPTPFTIIGTVPPTSSTEFRNMLSESLVLPLRAGNPITIINNGDAFLKSLLTDIDNAHSSINIMDYIWSDGKMSDEIFKHLDNKLKEGVEVRIMIDAFGSSNHTPGEQFKTFKDLGGKMEMFHSFTITPWELTKNQSRNHRRAITIDDIAYTGGMAIDDAWLGDAQNSKETRDMMFRVTGQMAKDIYGTFSELWTSMTGEILIENNYSTKIPATGENTLSYIPLASIPSPDSLALQKFILLSVLGAQKKIYLTTPYFLPDNSLMNALIAKAKAGVDVRILVPNKYNDVISLRYASQYSYEDFLKNGVKIYEYQPSFIHAKSIVIDGDWSIIGSANMDNRSRRINDESIFGISDATFGTELENIFLKDLEQAKEINLDEWRNRSILDRIREVFDRKFVQQY